MEIPLKNVSEKFSEIKKTKLNSAIRVSVNIAINIILKLFRKPDCKISVNIAVTTGPGIIPPIKPKTNAVINPSIII